MCVCFFFQAEDGIRDGRVTGVQTCALPICLLIIALVVKVVMAARPSRNTASQQGDEGSWRRIGNMPAEPSETTEPAHRSVEREADSRRGIERPLPPGFPV